MIRSDYRRRQPPCTTFPARCASPRRSPSSGARPSWSALRALMPARGSEGRRVALLGGEPGSGKSRLVREFAARGGRRTARSCSTARATRWCARRTGRSSRRSTSSRGSIEPAELRAALGAGGGELTRLLPDLPARVGELPSPVQADPDTERHRLHTAVTDLLAGVARGGRSCSCSRTATGPTRRRSCSCATSRGRPGARACCCSRPSATPRPTCRRRSSETLADLRRSDEVVRLRLTGSPDDEVAEFVRRAAGGRGPDRRSWRTRSASSPTATPFLVCELWRALVETGSLEIADGRLRLTRPLAELGSPESVREVVSQRLSRLSPRHHRRARARGHGGRRVRARHRAPRRRARRSRSCSAALDEAVRSGMLEELPSRRLSYRFTHELVRRALYDRLSGLRRAELHLRVGEALERGGEPSGRALADLAHHFAAAAPVRRRRARASSTTCGPRGRRPPRWPSTRRRSGCAPRSRSASSRPPGAAEASPRARHRMPPCRQGARRDRGVPHHRRDRPGAGGRAPARARGDRLRGRVLAPGPRRPGRRRAPRGGVSVRNKAVNPAWSAPDSPWAGAYRNETVPGGSAENPLKARWLGIVGGVGIHGTAAEYSIGTRASHGCIRMRVADVIDLYPRCRSARRC